MPPGRRTVDGGEEFSLPGRTPMIMALMVAAGAIAASFAIGFIARRAVARPLAGGAAREIAAPGRWGPLDAALVLAAPWPLKFVVDYALGHHRYPPWLAWMSAVRPAGVALAAALAGLLLLL